MMEINKISISILHLKVTGLLWQGSTNFKDKYQVTSSLKVKIILEITIGQARHKYKLDCWKGLSTVKLHLI